MINLLPLKEKIKRQREKDLKLILVIGILLFSFLIVFVLSFLAIKFYLSNQIDYYDSLIKAQSQKLNQTKIIERKVAEVNKILKEFNDFYENQLVMSDFLARINKLLVPGVKLDSFLFQGEENKVSISGTATSLQKAGEFRARLREEPDFKNLDFNLPNWLQNEEINFRVTFNFHTEK